MRIVLQPDNDDGEWHGDDQGNYINRDSSPLQVFIFSVLKIPLKDWIRTWFLHCVFVCVKCQFVPFPLSVLFWYPVYLTVFYRQDEEELDLLLVYIFLSTHPLTHSIDSKIWHSHSQQIFAWLILGGCRDHSSTPELWHNISNTQSSGDLDHLKWIYSYVSSTRKPNIILSYSRHVQIYEISVGHMKINKRRPKFPQFPHLGTTLHMWTK